MTYGALSAKIRALYGKRLRADDFARLAGLKNEAELLEALRQHPGWSRALSLVPHLSWNAIKAVSEHFTTLPQLRAASVADIEVIDGVGHYRAQLIAENLAHQAQAVGAGVVGW